MHSIQYLSIINFIYIQKARDDVGQLVALLHTTNVKQQMKYYYY